MAYTPNTWANGDVITDELLNHIEGGIANASSVIDCTLDMQNMQNITLTNADKVLAAIEAVREDPTKAFNYRFVLRDVGYDWGAVYTGYMSVTDGNIMVYEPYKEHILFKTSVDAEGTNMVFYVDNESMYLESVENIESDGTATIHSNND